MKYRGKASPRPSRAITPSTPQSEENGSTYGQYDNSDDESGEQTRAGDFLSTPEARGCNQALGALNGSSLHPSHGTAIFTPLPVRGLSQNHLQELDGHHKDTGNKPEEAADEVPGWDFVLPVIAPSRAGLGPDPAAEYDDFNLRELIAWIQYGAKLRAIQQYLDRFDNRIVQQHINSDVENFPAIFYVVETNKEDILRLWISYGGNVSAVHGPSNVPLLAFAIMHSENIQADTTLMTATLLGLGASPDVIPSAFYSPYLQDLPEHGPSDDSLKDLTDEQKSWCKDIARGKLARTCTLSQRYYLERAAKTKKPSRRQHQVAERMKAEPLLGIANFLIGQTTAAKALLDTLLAHITEPGKKPLVLVFAGPSGHGKTELAKCLGHLLSLELEVVDCTIFNREMELFGPRHPYVGAERGTPLNNFLAAHHGERCVVFLDEFEKTSPDIHKTLLVPFENGSSRNSVHI